MQTILKNNLYDFILSEKEKKLYSFNIQFEEFDFISKAVENYASISVNQASKEMLELLFLLLKYQYQKERRRRYWRYEIELLKFNYSLAVFKNKELNNYIESILPEIYELVLKKWRILKEVNYEDLPKELPYRFEDLLTEGWLP